MLREALDFPTSGDHGSRSLLVGSLLLLVAGVGVGGAGYAVGVERRPVAGVVGSVALLALLTVRGYYYRALAAAATERYPIAPRFGDIPRLLRDGVGSAAVGLAYLLPAGLLLGVSGTAATLSEGAGRPATLLAQAFGAATTLFGVVALAGALYLTPAAMAVRARGAGLSSAFQLRTVLEGAATEDYAVGWLLATALQWTFGLVGVLLSTLLVGSVLYFLTAVAARYIWGVSFATTATSAGVPKAGITPPNRDASTRNVHEMLLNVDSSDDGHREGNAEDD